MEIPGNGIGREEQACSQYPDVVLQKGSISGDYIGDIPTTSPSQGRYFQSRQCSRCNRESSCDCGKGNDGADGGRSSPAREKLSRQDSRRVVGFDATVEMLEQVSTATSLSKYGRKWEYFPGKNKFYFDGRLMTAPSIRFCVLCFLLILVTFVLFTIFDGPFLAERLTVAIPIIGFVLFFLVIVNMFKTSCSDPGILPRASAQESDFVEKSYASANGLRPPPRTKDIVVNGQTIKSKYCFTCKMFRPPRASHCGVCDNCVDRFDHHCPFLGNCIGKRNYRNFYTFIVSLSLLAVFVLSCSITKLALIGKEKGNFLDALRVSPASAVVILISFFGMWTVIGLAGFHTYLIAVEQTTNEDIKGLFGRSNTINPYTKGSMCHNCCFILCGPHQPSLIDSRGFVTSDFIASLPKKSGLTEVTTSPQCSLPTGSMRAPCSDGPYTPRSVNASNITPAQTMYQITSLDSGTHKLHSGSQGVEHALISASNQKSSSVRNSVPKAGTVPESGILSEKSTPSSRFGQSSSPIFLLNTSMNSLKLNSTDESCLGQSQSQSLYKSRPRQARTTTEDMSLSMVHLDFPEYNSPLASQRNGHVQPPVPLSSSTPLIKHQRHQEMESVPIGTPAAGGISLRVGPTSAAHAPVALAFDKEDEKNTMINSPLHLDSIS